MTHEEATERIKCILKNNSFTRADKNALELAIKNMPKGIIVDAVPVSELEKLRDYLYAEDLIFMRGLAKLNKLIAKYGGTKAGKTPDKNTKP